MRRVDIGRACVAALGVTLGGAWGCAANEAGTPAAAAPTAMKLESREPASIEEAQAQLERARVQLAGGTPATPGTPDTRATGATVQTTPGAGATTESTAGPTPPSAAPGRDAEGRCGNACGAVTSMRHAVDAICRMAGDTDARCTDARKTLRDSETKVAGCGCPPT
jgi:hypothetical protein